MVPNGFRILLLATAWLSVMTGTSLPVPRTRLLYVPDATMLLRGGASEEIDATVEVDIATDAAAAAAAADTDGPELLDAVSAVEEELEQDENKDENNETAAESVATTSNEEESMKEPDYTLEEDAALVPEGVLLRATELRLQGKEKHDTGSLEEAATLFQEAADLLQDHPDAEDYATCRLHQALCHLKLHNYDECSDACSRILESEDGDESPTHIANEIPAVRARAYHRRAKAKLGLGDTSGALADARSAAFLGDRKAVALYGKLMREEGGSSGGSLFGLSEDGASGFPDSSLLESLLSKSGSSGADSGFYPASLLMGGNDGGAGGLLKNLMGGGKNKAGGLAQSVLTNLSKRLDDEKTQDAICKFLQSANKEQLQQYASMAGVTIGEEQEPLLQSLVVVCNGVTPRKLRWGLRTTKAGIWTVRLGKKLARLLRKYRSLIVILILLQWSKSAVLRPAPLDMAALKRTERANKKELKQAERANKKQLNDAMKANR